MLQQTCFLVHRELETGNDQINGRFEKKMLQYKVLLVSMSGELFLLRSRGTKNMTLHLSNSSTKIIS